ncbi:GumC family protein [Bradyrhizobium genosp. P]|uniref:GumC family protein n=1 Tax=Bradyrhizobium genosp. P TaxID=83641 RepID=UPI003CF2A636
MLEKLHVEPEFPQADPGYLLEPAYYLGVLRRRWVYFVVPMIMILLAGAAGIYLWPATYYAEGKILVQSQQIPAELVRPTVTNAAQERIQVIQQRTVTRDNLLAMVEKFNLFPDRRALMSPTQQVDLMKERIKIEPVTQSLAFSSGSRPAIIFTVGFEYSDPQNATRVANELVTRILDLDLRDRTSRASDTTKFLAREVQRLQAESAAIDAKIAQARLSPAKPMSRSTVDPTAVQLAQLRAELAQKSAIYSERSFQIQSLKRQIEALGKIAPPPAANASASAAEPAPSPDIDALETQQKSIQASLEAASQKLAAARLGETLERDQQSEKLEVIEQPAVPLEPIRPNRPKVAGIVAVLSLIVGGGMAAAAELLDRAVRRSSDLYSIFDSELVVSIPYISTRLELRQQKKRFWLRIALIAVLLAVAAAGAYWFLPPLDLIIAKARVGLFR